METGRTNPNQHVVFVIRLWLEPREIRGDPEWRWYVRHVQSDNEAYFRRIKDVTAFVERMSGATAPK